MSKDFLQNYQYNSCIARGICSISPRNSALQTVLVLYLRLFSICASELNVDSDTRNFILNTISITIYNPDFNEKSYLFAIEKFKKTLPKFIKKFYEQKPNDEIKIIKEKSEELFNETSDIISAIKYGEKVFNLGIKKIPDNIRDLYNIILVIIKSMSINLLELESFNVEENLAFSKILKLLSKINLKEEFSEELKREIFEAVKIDYELIELLHKSREEKYGIQTTAEVSYSTIPNKAVLVVGSNINELEIILENLKDNKIDVYTHDEMMLAHTFPFFSKYPNLKGQFGQGLENCLIDFATFPGPIILTKNSLHNIENFYRGRLFTTDYTTNPKGIIKIENNDFSNVISSAEESKGFKTGKNCESVKIGMNFTTAIELIEDKIKSDFFDNIFIIAPDNYSIEQQAYFEKLIKHSKDNTLIISFSYNFKQNNLIHFNTCFDNYNWFRLTNHILNYNLPITVFVPKCEKNTISQIIYLSQNKELEIYIGSCTPIILNPSLINTIQTTFSIKRIGSAKKDLEEIYKDK